MRPNRVALVSCVSAKKTLPTEAADLYQSPWFASARRLAESSFDRWFILSAKHALLAPDQTIAPYDEYLGDASSEERIAWADRVSSQFAVAITEPCRVYLLAGNDYRRHLRPKLEAMGHKVYEPLAHLGIGKQLCWLRDLDEPHRRLRDVFELQALLEQIATHVDGPQEFRKVESKHIAARGIYFFLDEREGKSIWSPLPRIVRIGTHAVSLGSKATLWQRLRTHRGTDDGSGNHRASIFRLHVGRALIERGEFQSETWGKGQAASREVIEGERELERAVSKYIGSLRLLTLAIGDAAGPTSDRAYVEQCSIALVSGRDVPAAPADKRWLGRSSDRETIRRSGLWNLNHVFDAYDPRFLVTMALLVDQQLRGPSASERSVAPENWRHVLADHNRTDDQLGRL